MQQKQSGGGNEQLIQNPAARVLDSLLISDVCRFMLPVLWFLGLYTQ
jgi:cellobiose-specific phosphotransferase system component IIC